MAEAAKTPPPNPHSVPPTILPPLAEDSSASKELTDRFLKLSGYRASQVTGSRGATRTFVTENGGKYQLNKGGTALTTLLGPDFPKSRAAATEEE